MISWPMLAVPAYYWLDPFESTIVITNRPGRPAMMFKSEIPSRRKNRRQFRRKAREEWKKQSMKG